MIKRCIYCNKEIEIDCVVDMCRVCMYKVWGPKMAEAIVSGMTTEKAKGNMELGRVGVNGAANSSIGGIGVEVCEPTIKRL
jgi:hypothetical protein